MKWQFFQFYYRLWLFFMTCTFLASNSCFQLCCDVTIPVSYALCFFPCNCAFLYNQWGLPSPPWELLISHGPSWPRDQYSYLWASLSWISWCVNILWLCWFCFSNLIHFLFLWREKIVLNLWFTRWSRDFKESSHIKIPFLCNIILIEMLILWRENDW